MPDTADADTTGPRYARHAAFYQDAYPDAVVNTHIVGSIGAALMVTAQGPGMTRV